MLYVLGTAIYHVRREVHFSTVRILYVQYMHLQPTVVLYWFYTCVLNTAACARGSLASLLFQVSKWAFSIEATTP